MIILRGPLLVTVLAGVLFSLIIFQPHGHAQGYQCRTSPVGASTTYCASEAFVTKSAALSLGILTNARSPYTGANNLATTDCSKTVALGGSAFYKFTIGAASGFDSHCSVFIVDEDNVCPFNGASTCRGKDLSINGYNDFILWPGQAFILVNQNNVWQFNRPGRWYFGTNMTWYTDHANGTASLNDCLQPGASACKTIQQAVLLVQQNFDCSPQVNMTIQNAAETFTEDTVIIFGEKPCYHEIFITGSPSTPSNTVWNVDAGDIGLETRDYGITTINGFKFTSGGSGSTAFAATQMGVIDFANIEFGTFTGGTHISCVNNAGINYIGGTYVVSGNVGNHISGIGPCMITIASVAVSVPNALTFTNWIQLQAVSVVNLGSVTFTGAGAGAGSTGTKYNVSLNAVLISGGATIPGATGGSTGSGGQFQ